MPQPTPNFTTPRRGARTLAEFVRPCLEPALARQGFGEADILLHWRAIVGPMLADHCRPIKLQWRPRRAGDEPGTEPATLVVRVEGSFAVMLQHMVPTVLERVNGHLGWRCVGKMALRQGPLPAIEEKRPSVRTVDPIARRQAAALTETIEDEPLKAALLRLGTRVLDRRKRV